MGPDVKRGIRSQLGKAEHVVCMKEQGSVAN